MAAMRHGSGSGGAAREEQSEGHGGGDQGSCSPGHPGPRLTPRCASPDAAPAHLARDGGGSHGKRPLRGPFAALLFIVLCGVLSLPSALRRAVAPAPVLAPPPRLDAARLNAHAPLASPPSTAPSPRCAATSDDLLEGRLPVSLPRPRARAWRRDRLHPLHLRHHQFPVHRRGQQHADRDHHDSLLHPLPREELLLDPSLRRGLRAWHRLRHYDPAVLRDLPSALSLPGRIPSCAVVGNSGILLRDARGPLIDSHDAVFRLNNARVAGYAAHAGAKTNLSFINSNILTSARAAPLLLPPLRRRRPILLYICQASHFLDVAACNASSHKTHAAPISVTDRASTSSARASSSTTRSVASSPRRAAPSRTGTPRTTPPCSTTPPGCRPSWSRSEVCDRVSVFGFGKAADAKHHYHSNQKTELDLHDYEGGVRLLP
ncbi:hypothetical protein ACQ4PT_038446 [Festuca glaucescens]